MRLYAKLATVKDLNGDHFLDILAQGVVHMSPERPHPVVFHPDTVGGRNRSY